MIRLIIVEDERLIRQGIEKHVLWEELGIGEVRTAENAEEAFKICEEFSPDIIISDIKMPGMNGIQLCQKFRESLPESQIIFISGFSDKEYLKAAITLGAISYVEKPISIPELSEALEKAVISVRRLRRQSTNVLHSLLLQPSTDAESVIKAVQLSERGKILEKDSFFCVGLLHAKRPIMNVAEFSRRLQESITSLANDSDLHFFVDFVENNSFAIMISGIDKTLIESSDFKSDFWHSLIEFWEEEDSWFLGIGTIVDSLELVSESYQAAAVALKCISYKGWKEYAFYNETCINYKEKLPEVLQNGFLKALINKDRNEAYQVLIGVYNMLIENHAILNFAVRNIYYTLDSIISQAEKTVHLNSNQQQENIENSIFLDDAETILEMHTFVTKHVNELFEENEEERKNNFIIKNVMEYMQKNYGRKDISIQMLADTVYLTPTYLSGLFKKKTGMTIMQYLTEVRMKKAEELLRNPKLKLYQVAEMVGYDDGNYFAKIFKKITGMLPSEYRENKIL